LVKSYCSLLACADLTVKFAPQVGDVDNNLNRADAVLSKANPKNLDLLVLPELAFSGELQRAGFPYIVLPP